MPNIDLSILNQRQTPAFYADVFANRPAAGYVGRIFVSTDTFAFYRDNGTGWDLIGGPGTGTITGTGASGQIALWDGASTITGDTGLTYNGTDNSLTASKFIVTGGTSSQFLKGDGSLDSSAYLTTNIYNGNGTLSAERTVSLNGNNLIFDGGASIARVRMDADTNVARIFSFATNNLPRWAFRIDGTESGSDAGSDFAIRRYNDAGTFVDAPLTVTRSTGQSTFAKKVVIENNAGDQQLQIVSTTAPSLRIDNLQTGATKRIGLGLATAVNNFIQGSVDQDFCIFNSTTTASPILFGIYDAGLTNTQEAARISPARNFLVGKTTDGGQMLQVAGDVYFNGKADIGLVNILSSSTSSSITAACRVRTAVTMIGAEITMQALSPTSGSITIPNMYAYKTNTPAVQPNVTVTNSYGLYIGRTDDPVSGGVVTNKYALVTESTAGNIGFGTIAPTPISTFTTLEIRGATGAGIKLGKTATAQFNIHQDGTDAYFNNTQAGNIYFYTSDAERGRWTTSGNLLLGTGADAGQKLQVNGSGLFTGNLNLASGGDNLSLSRTSFTTWGIGVGTVSGISGLHIGTSTTYLSFSQTTGEATFTSAVKINNTVTASVVNTVTNKVAIIIGGVQYYLLASTSSV